MLIYSHTFLKQSIWLIHSQSFNLNWRGGFKSGGKDVEEERKEANFCCWLWSFVFLPHNPISAKSLPPLSYKTLVTLRHRISHLSEKKSSLHVFASSSSSSLPWSNNIPDDPSPVTESKSGKQRQPIVLSQTKTKYFFKKSIPVTCQFLYASAIFRTSNCTPKSA